VPVCKGKGEGKWNMQLATILTATGTHILYGITQCYLLLGRGDVPTLIYTPGALHVEQYIHVSVCLRAQVPRAGSGA